MSDDLITRMAEAACKAKKSRWDWPPCDFEEHPLEFQAEVLAEMEMLRDMVLVDAGRAILATKTTTEVRKRRLSLF